MANELKSEKPAEKSSRCDAPDACHGEGKGKTDLLLWASGTIVAIGYALHLFVPAEVMPASLEHFSHSVYEFMNVIWWGLLLGITFVGILNKVPRELVMGVLGQRDGLGGILRATAGGLLLDLCSHGILLVGMKLYERGASLGQTMAFLIASPWNSISLTIILFALIGVKWTLVFIALSAVIAIASGLIFERLVATGVLADNPYRQALGEPLPFWPELKRQWSGITWSPGLFREIVEGGLKESGMILRWMLFGVVLAALIRVLFSPEIFQTYFGPTIFGLFLTLVATTIIEVCSEGSSPIAADLINRAGAPGNAFTFLMAGAATDYTEIMGLKERTRSWKIALFLPIVTVPQVVVVGIILNQLA